MKDKMKGIILRGIGIVGILALNMLWAVPAHATAEPTSAPTISDTHANVYLLESGDVLIYGQYNIPYTTIPADGVDDTYVIRLISTDNVTELGAIAPFDYFDSGYNEGVFGMYFTASDNLTVDQPYTIRISQNPAYFASPQYWDYVMQLSDWTNQVAQDDNQTELTINVISMAEDLEAAHSETLLESSVGGTVLSDPTGETYFRGAIYGIQAMAPDLFLVQTIAWDTTDRTWATTEFTSYDTQFSGTFIGTATDNTSATFGLDVDTLMLTIYLLPIVIGSIIVSQIKFRKAEPGFIVSCLALILTALMGWINYALFALIFQLFAMYIGYLWFFSRSSGSFDSKMFNFMAFTWVMSTLICLVIEGSWIGSTEQTVINDLSAITSLNIGGLVPIPAPSLYFFRGLVRIFLWDYSFYTGDFEIFRYIFLVVFTGAAIWGIAEKFAPVFANFLRIR